MDTKDPRQALESLGLADLLELRPGDRVEADPGPPPGMGIFHGPPGVARLQHVPGAVLPLLGAVSQACEGDTLVTSLDSRTGPAAVEIVTEVGQDLVVVAEAGRERLFEIRREVPALPDWGPLAPRDWSHLVVDIDALLDGASCTPWLRHLAGEMAGSPWVLDRVAAAGLLARLWRPVDRAERDETLRSLVAGTTDTPTGRARRWARDLGPADVGEIARVALGDAGRQRDFPGDPPGQEGLLAALHQRDDLECIAWVLAEAGQGRDLVASLGDLDLELQRHLAAVAPGPGVATDERLLEVAATEPGAWWGEMAVQAPVDG